MSKVVHKATLHPHGSSASKHDKFEEKQRQRAARLDAKKAAEAAQFQALTRPETQRA